MSTLITPIRGCLGLLKSRILALASLSDKLVVLLESGAFRQVFISIDVLYLARQFLVLVNLLFIIPKPLIDFLER